MSLCFQLSVALDKQELLSPIPRFYLQHKRTGVGMHQWKARLRHGLAKPSQKGAVLV